MLKSEQLNFSINSGRIKPRFIDPEKAEILECASILADFYAEAPALQLTRGEVESSANTLVQSSEFPKIAAGFNKLLFDRCTFTPALELDYPAEREKIFTLQGARLLHKEKLLPPPEFDLYGDLPEFEVVQSFHPLTAAELLDRYNMAQAQGLIALADSVEITISTPETAELRRVMKAVKFFRLLAQFSVKNKDSVVIAISGPFALFGPSRKYALLLASLLPVIARTHSKWKLHARLRVKNRLLTLHLDHKSPLKSPSRSFSAVIPEDIRLYHRLFAEKKSPWEIVGEAPFIDGGNQQIFFPDLSFRHRESGQTVHLELFHRWHSGQLAQRLEFLRQHPELPLIIGIDRALTGKGQTLEELLQNDGFLLQRCWLFRDFPGVENTLRALNKFSGQ